MPRMSRLALSVGTLYPAPATALRSCSSGSPEVSRSTAACSVARFTETRVTPGTPLSADSTWDTQAAQVIPSTGMVI